jgi:hypothetical protein
VFRQCLFVDNAIGAIAHTSLAASEDRIEMCYLCNTSVRGGVFAAGSVVASDCLFASEVPSMPESFIPTGVQVSFTSTVISFDTISLLPMCGGVAGLPTGTQRETPPESSPLESPLESSPPETPLASDKPDGGLTGGVTAGIVVGVVAVVAAVGIVIAFVALKRTGDAGSHDLGGCDTADEAAAAV